MQMIKILVILSICLTSTVLAFCDIRKMKVEVFSDAKCAKINQEFTDKYSIRVSNNNFNSCFSLGKKSYDVSCNSERIRYTYYKDHSCITSQMTYDYAWGKCLDLKDPQNEARYFKISTT